MRLKYKIVRFLLLFLLSVSAIAIFIIAIKMTVAAKQTPLPQAILTLGGGADREKFTAQIAQAYPDLSIWVSTGQSQEQTLRIFNDAEINLERVNLDYRATDTVTNFTSLVKDFKSLNYQHLYLITSDFHMARAKAIAFIVLGSHGIAYTPLEIPSNKETESKLKVVRDLVRAIVWLITGKSGSSLKN